MDSWYKVIDPNNPGPDHELVAGAYGYSILPLAKRYLNQAIESEDPEAFQAALVELEKKYNQGKGNRNRYSIVGPTVNLVYPDNLVLPGQNSTVYQTALLTLRNVVREYGDDSFLDRPFQITGIETTGHGVGKKRPMIIGQYQVEDPRLKRTFDIPPSLVPPDDWIGVFNAFEYTLSHGGE